MPDDDATRFFREGKARMEAGDNHRAEAFAALSIAASLAKITDLLLERR